MWDRLSHLLRQPQPSVPCRLNSNPLHQAASKNFISCTKKTPALSMILISKG